VVGELGGVNEVERVRRVNEVEDTLFVETFV
jgi:hypothetical protein